jgi:hypothetical protein
VRNIELSVHRQHALDSTKRLRRVVSVITAAALSASLIAAAAGPASAAVGEPARTAPIVSFATSDNGLRAVSLMTAARYVHPSDGHFTLDTLGAKRAGASSQALRTEGDLVTSLNKLLDHETTTANSARDGIVIDFAQAVPAAAQDTTITVVPGITLTIASTGIQLSLTKEAVTEVENVLGFGQSVASLVGSILAVAQVPNGGAIAGIVASSLGLANGLLKLCTAPDGSATFTIPFFGLPSCSGVSLVA